MGPLGKYGKDAQGYFMFPKLEGEIHPHMTFRGKKVLTWSLNNYLGLANHPEVREADAQAAKEWGLGYPMGARMMSGHTSKHEELEAALAEFVGKEDAYLLNYGYQGMVSIIDSLAARNDVIVYDSECHACIMDGIFLHKAKGGKSFVFPHNDMERCEKMLNMATKRVKESGGGILVITEGVFGMAGDLGHLHKIVALKEKYDFRILVDDAHGFGTMGPTGAGVAEHYGVTDKIDIIFGTFAKSMAGIGAFVASREDVIQYLRYNMRSQIFAKSLPMPMVIGAMKRLELLRTHPELKEQLWTVVKALQKGLRDAGFNLGNTESPVTPVYLNGTVPEATNLTMDLRENYNIFCSIVVYPVIPKGQIMLRLIPTAAHTLEDVEFTIKAFSKIKENLEAGKYQSDKIASLS
ncbi:aminotransferase class I/II-fold pyridoxal phosphate-dependent enzyme [Thermophagus xiamenensis]|uniref:Glycine C-acetyltransferase n=1 Tax=Thermophagus xiamenensis TaxID=385682 RepID=A0A1I2EX17_9BACT|nr:aminotransferase class I/II-fold pyridoxal phosphate-dependent enzyme [Thermophagus xiamenensis]SFE97662.1 glycine C-acetyltransferase [Thermophagus xiamenensis]